MTSGTIESGTGDLTLFWSAVLVGYLVAGLLSFIYMLREEHRKKPHLPWVAPGERLMFMFTLTLTALLWPLVLTVYWSGAHRNPYA